MTEVSRQQRLDIKMLTSEYLSSAQTAMDAAKQKARHMVNSARDLIPNVSLPQVDALSTVMFSPLAAHPVYRSEKMMKAMQMMQQQQQRASSSSGTTTAIAPRSDLILHGRTYAWPSSAALLEEEIPELNTPPVTLFQGFAATYPSLAKRSKKKSRQRKKKTVSETSSVQSESKKEEEEEAPRTVNQIISQRERKIRESDRISMQKSSIVNEIEQLDLQINELLTKRKALEQRWEELELKDTQLRLIIEELDEAIVDIEVGGDGRLPLTKKAEPDEEIDSPIELYRRLFTVFKHEDDDTDYLESM
ncbi:hypothetical protein RMCBS344292_10433 [Rhizopus microsporus]|nr:hypothetical protein RMCBS344292_10433 [Rhizopus microsporus]